MVGKPTCSAILDTAHKAPTGVTAMFVEAMEGDCCPSTAHGEATLYFCARNKGRELKNAEKMCQTRGKRDKSLGVVSSLMNLGRQNTCPGV